MVATGTASIVAGALGIVGLIVCGGSVIGIGTFLLVILGVVGLVGLIGIGGIGGIGAIGAIGGAGLAGLCGAGGLLGTLGAAFGGAGIIGIVQSICITITGILGAIFTCISGIIAPDSTANMLRTFRDYIAS